MIKALYSEQLFKFINSPYKSNLKFSLHYAPRCSFSTQPPHDNTREKTMKHHLSLNQYYGKSLMSKWHLSLSFLHNIDLEVNIVLCSPFLWEFGLQRSILGLEGCYCLGLRGMGIVELGTNVSKSLLLS